MTAIILTYLILINLIGFVLMGIDKRRAITNRWRISERTLFLVALLFGCIGVQIGMHVFRHKTKHPSFRIGLPVIAFLQIMLLLFAAYLWFRFAGSPTRTVQRELAQIRELDADTLQSFLHEVNLSEDTNADAGVRDIRADVIALFFKNFDYQIQGEEIEDDKAVVNARITNIDAHALARDLCTKILQRSVSVYPESTVPTTNDYYQLLHDTLAGSSYELVTTTVTFHLSKNHSRWEILTDDTLEDQLVSGFISYMNDPYILPAASALSIQLDALKALTAEQWAEYLSVDDIFATYNTDYSQAIDEEYIRQMAAAFDYKILRCEENGAHADAVVRITSIDMGNVLSIYKEHLLSYAATTKSLRDDDIQFSNETARLLLQSLQENTGTTSTDIDISFNNNGSIWDISFDQEFTNALMGNMSGAIEQFNSAAHDTETVIVAPVD